MRERFWASRKIVMLMSLIIITFLSTSTMLKTALTDQLASYNYSIPYESVKSEIDNPRTHGGLYPDTLDWSAGGEVKFGLKALIGCNKRQREYLVTEPIGVRAGIRNDSDSSIQLGFAYYSPNKHGIPPEYTVFIEGPYNYPHIIGYLGDDALYGGPRTKLKNMIHIPPGGVFNPSFDSLFYNSSDGLFSFETPGTYKLWFTYSFDSLTSNLSVPLTLISSDTIEFRVIPPEFIDAEKLAKFLPKRIDSFKGGKLGIQHRLLNPHWTESLKYPMAYRNYYRKNNDSDSSTIGIFITDSGFLPELAGIYNRLCRIDGISKTTVRGFPTCTLFRPAEESDMSHVVISTFIAQRIIVSIEGFKVGVEEAEKAAKTIDYNAIARSIEP